MVKRVELHHYAKFCRNRFNCGWDIAIFRYFKMAAAAILDFRNFEFLTFATVKRVDLHHPAKFRRNRSNRGRNMWVSIVWLENAYSRPFMVFLGTFPPNDVSHRPNPKKDHPWAELCHLSHKSRIFSYWFLNRPYKSPLIAIGFTLRGPRNGFLGFFKYGGGKYFKSK